MDDWKSMLETKLVENGEFWDSIESNTMTEEKCNLSLIQALVGRKVYIFYGIDYKFCILSTCYDGAEWVGSAARHPNSKPTHHQGD